VHLRARGGQEAACSFVVRHIVRHNQRVVKANGFVVMLAVEFCSNVGWIYRWIDLSSRFVH